MLHAEQPVVQKEAVPVERVRLDTKTVTEQQQVSEQVAKEQIEVGDPTGRHLTATAGVRQAGRLEGFLAGLLL